MATVVTIAGGSFVIPRTKGNLQQILDLTRTLVESGEIRRSISGPPRLGVGGQGQRRVPRLLQRRRPIGRLTGKHPMNLLRRAARERTSRHDDRVTHRATRLAYPGGAGGGMNNSTARLPLIGRGLLSKQTGPALQINRLRSMAVSARPSRLLNGIPRAVRKPSRESNHKIWKSNHSDRRHAYSKSIVLCLESPGHHGR